MRRPARSLSAALLLGTMCTARAASAQDFQYRAAFAAGLQVTDNVRFAPINPRTGEKGPEPGVVAELNPAITFSYETPRWLHQLQYAFNFAVASGAGDQINYANRVDLRSRYDISEVTNINFAVRAAQGQQTMFPAPPPGQVVPYVPPGTFTFANVEVAENLARALSDELAFTQAIGANVFFPIDPDPPRPIVFGANSQLALVYTDGLDAYGANLGTQLAATDSAARCDADAQCGAGRFCTAAGTCEIIGDPTPEVRALAEARLNVPQLTNRLGLTYRHDFNNGFNFELDAGVQQLMRLTDGGGQFWQPAGRLGVRYEREEAAIGLTFNHGMGLNVDLGGIVLADNVELVGAVPIDRETRRFALALQTGYQHGTVVDAVGTLLPGFNAVAAEAALVFRPERWLPNFTAAIRYQFRYQINEPVPGALRVAEETHLVRNAVALNLAFEYPDRAQ